MTKLWEGLQKRRVFRVDVSGLGQRAPAARHGIGIKERMWMDKMLCSYCYVWITWWRKQRAFELRYPTWPVTRPFFSSRQTWRCCWFPLLRWLFYQARSMLQHGE